MPENTNDDDKLTLSKQELEEMIQESLKPIKGKLDNVYQERDTLKAERDALKAEKDAFEEQKRQLEIEKLKEEGKLKEAFEAQLADEKIKRENAEKEAASLKRSGAVATRDRELMDAIAVLDFKTPKARTTAFNELREQFSQNTEGLWVHASGKSLQEVITAYGKDADNEYLFKVVTSSGFTQGNSTTGAPTTQKVGEMSQQELLAKIQSGELRRNKG